jgi:hypothetical protein
VTASDDSGIAHNGLPRGLRPRTAARAGRSSWLTSTADVADGLAGASMPGGVLAAKPELDPASAPTTIATLTNEGAARMERAAADGLTENGTSADPGCGRWPCRPRARSQGAGNGDKSLALVQGYAIIVR